MTMNEIIEKYGSATLYFKGYYKYMFTYSGEYNGDKITVEVGGNPDDIYRADLSEWETIGGLDNETTIAMIRVNSEIIYTDY